MVRPPIDFDWQIGDSTPWLTGELLNDGSTPTRQLTEAHLTRIFVRGMILFCIGLCTASSTPLSTALVARQQAAEGIHFALLQEKRTHESGDTARFGGLIDSDVIGQWRSRWRTAWENGLQNEEHFGVTLLAVSAQDELAIATVLVDDPAPEWGNVSLYRKQRYYRQRGQQWLRTMPTAAFWGKLQVFETTHFRFEYYAPDAAAVLAVGAQIEQIYAALYRRLGLDLPKGTQLTFVFVPEVIRNWRSLGTRIEMTSPALAQIPAPLTDEMYLLQLVTERLGYQGLEKAMARMPTGTEYRWNLLRWGIHHWLVTELTGEPIPWLVEAEAALQKLLPKQSNIELDLINRWDNTGEPDPTELMARYALAETVARYVVITYGADSLPNLVQNLSVHATWKELIPYTFGVPLVEFEASWQAYVWTHYGPGEGEP